MNQNYTIKKIVLTGGPCAGKTTIFKEIKEHLLNKGYYVITLSETAEELIKNQMIPNSEKEHTLMFQDVVFQLQYRKEQIAQEYANKIVKKQNVIILCDRGINDNKAYLETEEEFKNILNKYNQNELLLLDNYDLVIDLVSTATSKKDSYSLNGIRTETVEEAENLDKKTSIAWLHHKNIKLVKPTEKIETKTTSVINIIDNFLNNNIQEHEITELDYNSDFSIYNDDNSKILNIQTFYLENNITINKKDYQSYSLYIYEHNNKIKNIDKNTFTDILLNNKIIYTEKKQEIIFLENSNIYKIININNNYYLEYEKNKELILPENLKLLNNKTLVKRKKYGNI